MAQRPKIEVFDECLPGRIAFGDVDGIVEINGNALMLEWKADPKDLPVGQSIMYSRLTRANPIGVLMLAGDAATMGVTHWRAAWNGKISDWEPCDLNAAKDAVKTWVDWAQRHPATASAKVAA